MPRKNDDDDLPGAEETPTPKAGKKNAPKAPPAPEPESEPEPTPTPKPAHSPRLVRLAQTYGISQADIDSLTSEELMAEIGYEQERIKVEQSRKVAEPPPAAAPKPAAAAEVDPLEEIEQMVKDGAITEQVARVMRAPLKEAKALKEKLARLDELEEREKVRAGRTIDDALNDVFSQVSDRYGKYFGIGDVSDLKDGSDERNRRILVVRSAGLQPTDSEREIKKKVMAVIRLTYGEGSEAAAPKPSVGAQTPAGTAAASAPRKKTRDEEWREAELARPSARNGATEPKGPHGAKLKVAEIMKERGLEPGYIGTADDDSDLPGGPD